jgi:serpin B
MTVRYCVARTSVCALLLAAGAMSAPDVAVGQRGGDSAAPRVMALTHAYNESGHDLFAHFITARGNVVFSPYSIGTAMAMALSGARGATETEMMTVLHQRLPRPQIDAANAEVIAVLNGYQKSSAPPLKLAIANALMITRPGSPISREYSAMLHDKYSAELFEHATLERVNEWVKSKTEGKIDKLLDGLDPNSVAVLVNAVYFKAPWATTFDRKATTDEEFALSATEKAAVPMMHAQSRYAIATGEGYRAIRLPYSGNTLAMIVVLPDPAVDVDRLAARLTADGVTSLAASLTPQQTRLVDLALPRFKASFRAGLVEPFARLGMAKAFDLKLADFSGMTGRAPRAVPVAIDDIVHRAVIEVNEEGTEAAAATGIGMRTTAVIGPPPVSFRVDRAFLFYILDSATQAVLFQGRIVDPRAN